jgi:hypothetical protein
MHSPFITTNGGQRVDCCNYACNQGKTCPTRQACELPEADPTRIDWTAIGIRAAALLAFGAICAAPFFFR